MFAALIIAATGNFAPLIRAQTSDPNGAPGAAGEPYSNMPLIAPIGVRIAKYMDVPAASQGPAIDPAKGS